MISAPKNQGAFTSKVKVNMLFTEGQSVIKTTQTPGQDDAARVNLDYHCNIMASQSQLFLLVFLSLIDLSKQGCKEYFEPKKWANLTENITLISTDSHKEDILCTLWNEGRNNSCSDKKPFSCVLRHCHNKTELDARCSQKTKGNDTIHLFHFWCFLAHLSNKTECTNFGTVIKTVERIWNALNPDQATAETTKSSPTATSTISSTATLTISPTATSTISPTATSTISPTATSTISPTATSTISSAETSTISPTATSTISSADTSTISSTATSTISPTATSTISPTATSTISPAATSTISPPVTSSPLVTLTTSPTTPSTISPTTKLTISLTTKSTISMTATSTISPPVTSSPPVTLTSSSTTTSTISPTTKSTISPTTKSTISPMVTSTISPPVTLTSSPTTTSTKFPPNSLTTFSPATLASSSSTQSTAAVIKTLPSNPGQTTELQTTDVITSSACTGGNKASLIHGKLESATETWETNITIIFLVLSVFINIIQGISYFLQRRRHKMQSNPECITLNSSTAATEKCPEQCLQPLNEGLL